MNIPMSRNAWMVAVVVLILVVGGWLLTRPQQTSTPTPAVISTPQPAAPSATEGAMMQEETTVTMSSSGFSPKDITIKAGAAVTWVNEDSESHQVNSAVHPTHQLYLPLNTVGLIKSGEKKSLSFPEAGTYKYHDHLTPSLTGSVTVE